LERKDETASSLLSINISIINQRIPTISPHVNFLILARKKDNKSYELTKIKKIYGHLFIIIAINEYGRYMVSTKYDNEMG